MGRDERCDAVEPFNPTAVRRADRRSRSDEFLNNGKRLMRMQQTLFVFKTIVVFYRYTGRKPRGHLLSGVLRKLREPVAVGDSTLL
jgi:hypothetical protein